MKCTMETELDMSGKWEHNVHNSIFGLWNFIFQLLTLPLTLK